MTLGSLLIGASLTAATELLPWLTDAPRKVSWLHSGLALLLSISLSTLAFALLYQTVPNRFIDWREAAVGGLVAAVGFEITRRLFAFSIAIGGGYKAIYGALAAVPIFLIWIYLFWLITLLGAVVAAALPVMRYERWWHRTAPGSEFLDAVAVLKALYDARDSHAAVDALRLRELTHLGFEESESLLQRMHEVGWVGRIRPQRTSGFQLRRKAQARLERWTLLINPARLTLADVYQRFAFTPDSNSPLAQQVAHTITRDLSTTLADYFTAAAANPNSASST